MKNDDRNGRRQIDMPAWAVEAFKMVLSAVVAVGLCLVKFSVLEARVGEHHIAIADFKTKLEGVRDSASKQEQKTDTLEVRQALNSSELKDSLKRIEDDVKELKADFKNQRKSQP